nr:hypothetical protein [Tanacetum cinerariifolium]
MRRAGKGFSGVETPLFEGMLVAPEVSEVHGEEVNAGDTAKGDVSAAHGEVPTVQPTPPHLPQVQPQSPQPQPQPQQDAGIPMNLLQEVMDTCAALTRRVEHLEFYKVAQTLELTKLRSSWRGEISETITAASETITTAEAQVPAVTLTTAPARVTAAPSGRRKGVDEAIDNVKKKAKEDPAMKRYQVLKRKPQTKAQARKNMMVYLKNVAGFKIDYFKGMSYDDIRPILEAKCNTNVAFLVKTKEHIEEEESRALKRLNETSAKKAAKKQMLDGEVEEIKRHLQIVPNEDADVYTEATPLARKVSVVDYQIIELNNKPYYKIIRADDTHQLYVSFMTLLRNFNIEDLEAL